MARTPKTRPDPILVKDQLQLLQFMYNQWGAEDFSRYMIWIQVKRELYGGKTAATHTRLVPFQWNKIQRNIWNNLGKRNIVLKPRQIGITTWMINMRLFVPTLINPGTNGILVSQKSDSATKHFSMLRRAYKFIGAVDPAKAEKNYLTVALQNNLLHTAYSNRKELIFDQLDCSLSIESAEVEELGQGLCLLGSTWITDADFNLKRFKDVSVGDTLINSKGLPCKVTNKFYIPKEKHPYKGRAIKIGLRSVKDFSITGAPNHPFLTQRGMVEAQHLTLSDYVAYPKVNSIGTKRRIWLRKTHRTCNIAVNGSEKSLLLTHNFGFLLGMYLGDGIVTERSVHIIMMAARKKAYALPKLRKAAKELGFELKQHGKVVGINSALLAEWVDENLGRTKTKHIPDWWREAPREFLEGLLFGWITADAWWNTQKAKELGQIVNFVGYSKVARLAFGMKELTTTLGFGMPYMLMERRRNSKTVVCGVPCKKRGVKYELHFGNETSRLICKKMNLASSHCADGWQARRRKVWYQDSSFVYIPVVSLKKTHVKAFYDITVNSKNHLYCLPYSVTHNTLHRSVCSEVARWPGNPEETMANMKEAIVLEGTLDLESTANGMGGYFCEEYFRAANGESDFTAHFSPWWDQDEYRVELTAKQKAEMEADLKEDERKLREAFHLELEQIAFRREKKKSLRHNFDEKYPESAATAFLVSGSTFFDRDVLAARAIELTNYKPYKSFGNGTGVIFKRPIRGRLYVIGADPAAGKQVGSNTDFSAAKVIDLDTAEEVASYMARVSPEDFALDLEWLGKTYNNATLAVERGVGADSGGEGGTVLLTLVNQRYPQIYKHREFWRRDSSTKATIVFQEGFPMSPRNRPVVLNKLRSIINNHPELIYDNKLITQALMFVRDEKGKPAAQEGQHDDMVLASAIAQGVRMILLGYWDVLVPRREKYSDTPSDEAAPEELEEVTTNA